MLGTFQEVPGICDCHAPPEDHGPLLNLLICFELTWFLAELLVLRIGFFLSAVFEMVYLQHTIISTAIRANIQRKCILTWDLTYLVPMDPLLARQLLFFRSHRSTATTMVQITKDVLLSLFPPLEESHHQSYWSHLHLRRRYRRAYLPLDISRLFFSLYVMTVDIESDFEVWFITIFEVLIAPL